MKVARCVQGAREDCVSFEHVKNVRLEDIQVFIY